MSLCFTLRGREVVMTTFELDEVRSFAANLDAQMDRCDNGEGIECATIDATLAHYTEVCRRFCCEVRLWARSVFTGRTQYQAEVEKAFTDAGFELFVRAKEMSWHGERLIPECFEFSGGNDLKSVLWMMEALLDDWITPKLAVGPAARRPFDADSEVDERSKSAIDLLPPLPPDWEPTDQKLRVLFQKAQNA
jgi:hypothetical protein